MRANHPGYRLKTGREIGDAACEDWAKSPLGVAWGLDKRPPACLACSLQAVRLRLSTCLSHSPIWFQLPSVWLTTFTSESVVSTTFQATYHRAAASAVDRRREASTGPWGTNSPVNGSGQFLDTYFSDVDLGCEAVVDQWYRHSKVGASVIHEQRWRWDTTGVWRQ